MKRGMIVLLLLTAGTVAMAQRGSNSDSNSGRGKPPTAAELIAKLDTDGDGKISEAEFDGPSEHFSQFDANNDGYLSTDEIPSGPPSRGGGGGRDRE